jgi:hypothetical protein
MDQRMNQNRLGIWPFNLLRKPIQTDWIFWLWLVALFASLVAVLNRLSSEASASVNPLAGFIDFFFAVIIQTLFFLVLPAQIRKSLTHPGQSLKQTTIINVPVKNYEFELTNEMKEFLDSLEVVPRRLDGWYRDPSGFSRLRYFYKGKWTPATSNSENESEKSLALSEFLPIPARTQGIESQSTEPLETRPKQSVVAPTSNQLGLGNIASDLFKLATLLDRGLLSREEFEEAKLQLLRA